MKPYAMIQVSILFSVTNQMVEMSHLCFITKSWKFVDFVQVSFIVINFKNHVHFTRN